MKKIRYSYFFWLFLWMIFTLNSAPFRYQTLAEVQTNMKKKTIPTKISMPAKKPTPPITPAKATSPASPKGITITVPASQTTINQILKKIDAELKAQTQPQGAKKGNTQEFTYLHTPCVCTSKKTSCECTKKHPSLRTL
jgi:hypothetical protein